MKLVTKFELMVRLEPLKWLFGVVAVVAVWLLARPYIGVRHDGLLYLGQALLNLGVEGLRHDFFFAFGSQDSFTVFSPIAVAAYRWLGFGPAQLLIQALCHGALLAAIWVLTRGCGTKLQRWLGLLCFAGMSHFYGGLRIFSVAEPFITARTLAEPVVVWALVLLTRSTPTEIRPFKVDGFAAASGLLLMLSAAIHPLVALPGLGIWVAWWARERLPIYGIVIGLLLLLVALSLMGLLPSTRLTDRFDELWLEAIRQSSQHVFVGRWNLNDYLQLAVDFVVLYAAQSGLQGAPRRLIRAVLVAVSGLLFVAALGADLLSGVLVTQLQLWRVQWIGHLLALVLLPGLLLQQWSTGALGRAQAVSWALAYFTVDVVWPSAAVFVLWAVLIWQLERASQAVVARWSGRLFFIAMGAAGFLIVALLFKIYGELTQAGKFFGLAAWIWALARLPIVTGILLGLAAWAFRRQQSGSIRPIAAVAAAFLFLLAGIAHWDRRSDWARQLETLSPAKLPVVQALPHDSQILWLDQMAAVWTQFHRASYFSYHQGAGLLFNRGTAEEFLAREAVVKPLYFHKEVCSLMAALQDDGGSTSDACTPSLELVKDVCRHPRGPDHIVLSSDYGRAAAARLPVAMTDRKEVFIHACADLVAASSEVTP